MTKSERVFRIGSIVLIGVGFSMAVDAARTNLSPETLSTFISDLKTVEVAHQINSRGRAENHDYTLGEPQPEAASPRRIQPSDILSHEVK